MCIRDRVFTVPYEFRFFYTALHTFLIYTGLVGLSLSIVKKISQGPRVLAYVWHDVRYFVDCPTPAKQAPHYCSLLNRKSTAFMRQIVRHLTQCMDCLWTTWLLLLNVDDIGGFCRWSIHLTSAISKAHAKETYGLAFSRGVTLNVQAQQLRAVKCVCAVDVTNTEFTSESGIFQLHSVQKAMPAFIV